MSKDSSTYERQLHDLMSMVSLKDEKSYTIDGQEYQVYQQQPSVNQYQPPSEFGSHVQQDEHSQRLKLTNHLTHKLYTYFYCGMCDEERPMPSWKDRESFMKQLSAANHSSYEPDRNWTVYSVDDHGNGFAQKNDVLRPVIPGTFLSAQPHQRIAVNQKVDFYRQRENIKAQPVFYFVFGDTYLPPDCEKIRVYWHIKPEGAALLIQKLTQVLNSYRIPFQFKCLNHPQLYIRSDAAVLYIDKNDQKIIGDLLKPILDELKDLLNPTIPMFTDQWVPGVGVAEDPGNGESFGMSRAMAIAQGLVALLDSPEMNVADRQEYMKKHLLNRGIDVDKMSRNLSTHHYRFAEQPKEQYEQS